MRCFCNCRLFFLVSFFRVGVEGVLGVACGFIEVFREVCFFFFRIKVFLMRIFYFIFLRNVRIYLVIKRGRFLVVINSDEFLG